MLLIASAATTTVLVAIGALLLVVVGAPLFYVLRQRARRQRAQWIYRTNRRPDEVKRVAQGRGLGIEELCRRTGIEERQLRQGMPRYTRATIPKRRGGVRHLHVPDDGTKRLQRTLLRRLFAKLRAHPAATGFEQGRSIVHHARIHTSSAVVVTMDVIDFFPATTATRVEAYFRRIGWDQDVAQLLTLWTTHEDGLPQGAPTSPRLSNLVNYYLDVQLTTIARRRRATYTRYGDDIALSFKRVTSPRRVRGTMQMVRNVLKQHGYQSHGRRKTKIQPATRRQVVTGLVVNDKVNLPRRTRRRLRAVAHHHSTGRPGTLTPQQLQGWLAFAAMIERQRDSDGEVKTNRSPA